MRKPASGPALAVKPPRVPLKSEILWGCESGGSPRFPLDMGTIHNRRNAPEPMPMLAFTSAVSASVERIWIVDEYFLVPPDRAGADSRIRKVLEWLPPHITASDIRILTKDHKQINDEMLLLFESKQNDINAKRRPGQTRCRIEVCTRLTARFDHVHDRFAIIDDELWHFGATVGGFHPRVNAASRGWDAEASGAIDFFILAWDMCKER